MKRLLLAFASLLFCIALGIAIHCAIAWYRGGSGDPRCVYNWKGYVEVYAYRPTGISCEYRPEVGRE